MMGVGFWAFIIARFLWNLAFLGLHPLVVVLTADLLDAKDSAFYIFTGESTKELYHTADKLADLSFYISAFTYYFYFRKELWYARVLAYAFLFRAVGNIIFIALSGIPNWVPYVFPAVAMPWMIFYSFLDYGFVVRNYDRRWDRWLRKHTSVHVCILVLILIIWEIKEIVQWKGGNNSSPDDVCSSELICAGLLLPIIAAMIGFGIYMGVNRTPHFEPNTVRYTRGVPSKKKPKSPVSYTLQDALQYTS